MRARGIFFTVEQIKLSGGWKYASWVQAIYSRTVVRQFSYVRRSYDINTTKIVEYAVALTGHVMLRTYDLAYDLAYDRSEICDTRRE